MPDYAFFTDMAGALLPLECLQPRFMRQALLGLLLLAPVTAVTGVRVEVYQYAFAILLALTSVLAVWTVGVFLVSALLILPAAAARNLARSAGGMFWWALAISCVSSVAGLVISAQRWAGTATGPTVVLVAAVFFILSVPLGGMRRKTAAHQEKA